MITFESLEEGPKQEKHERVREIVVPWTASYISTGPGVLWAPKKANYERSGLEGWSQGEGIPSLTGLPAEGKGEASVGH